MLKSSVYSRSTGAMKNSTNLRWQSNMGNTSRAKANSNLLKKGLNVLLCFLNSSSALSLSEIAKRTSFPTSTTARVLLALEEMGFVERDEKTKLFELGIKCYQLGLSAKKFSKLRHIAFPIMSSLFERYNETVTLYKKVGYSRVCYDQIVTSQRLKQSAIIGDAVPLWVASPGRCILAYMPEADIDNVLCDIKAFTERTILDKNQIKKMLEEVRQFSYSTSFSERDEGVSSVSSPILDENKCAIGCITISGPEVRLTKEKIESMVPEVIKAARKISEMILISLDRP